MELEVESTTKDQNENVPHTIEEYDHLQDYQLAIDRERRKNVKSLQRYGCYADLVCYD